MMSKLYTTIEDRAAPVGYDGGECRELVIATPQFGPSLPHLALAAAKHRVREPDLKTKYLDKLKHALYESLKQHAGRTLHAKNIQWILYLFILQATSRPRRWWP